jgi:amino acid adenylation domain-containing protein
LIRGVSLALNFTHEAVAHLTEARKTKMLAKASFLPSPTDQDRLGIDKNPELSLTQEQIWLDEQLTPGTAAYNIPIAAHLTGTLDSDALARTLTEIVRRHDVLRARFHPVAHRPTQIIADDPDVTFRTVDLTDVPADDRVERAKLACQADCRRPFSLLKGPLYRFTLYRLAPDEHVFLATLHHIVFDGWSIGIFLKELTGLYAAFAEGRPSPLPALPVGYCELGVKERQTLSAEAVERLVAFWRKHLAGIPPHLALPFDHPVRSGRHYRGGRFPVELSEELTIAVKTLSRAESVTVFMTVLSALAALLYRYTGQMDIVIGTPIAGRRSVKSRSLLGAFVNTLVLRTDLSGGPTFRELIARARRSTHDAFAHQELPYNQLVRALNPERDATGASIVQIMLVLQNMPHPELQIPGLTIELLDIFIGAAKYDLTLELENRAGRLTGWFDYDSDLFDRPTVARLAGHFQTILEAAVGAPDRPVDQLPLLSENEARQLVATWIGTPAEFPRDTCLNQLVEAHALRTPHAVAVVCGSVRLTYGELNVRANRLAHHLIQLGVRPGVLVAICVERSLEMVVGLLAILKSGGAYVPLDPDYPAERLAFLLHDSAAPVLLTQNRLLTSLPKSAAQVVCLDADSPSFAGMSDSNPQSVAGPVDVAYVIYTSGSTGDPKGVLVSHHNVVRLFRATQPWFHFDEHDVWTLFHSFAFDFSVWEIWGALCYGGRLVVVPSAVTRSPQEFHQLLVDERVTVLNQTPSAFRPLTAADQAAHGRAALCLRLVIFGGEALELESLRPWFLRHGDNKPQLVNMYGITETTVHVTYRPIELVDLDSAPGSVIGRPIPDLRLYILEPNGQPAPPGVPGEICVGGAGVAKGYLNNPELTAQKFIRDPFASQPDARLYRSGDLARFLPNGDIEYLGRIDQQVKIRGFRIELGEIESNLLRHGAVREAVVLAREDQPGEKRLVAYVVADRSTPALGPELRTFLKQRLPEYSIPSVFVVLDSLPLTPHGKVDRRALPSPSGDRPEVATPYVAPKTPNEIELARIWTQVLRLDRIGVHDQFFDVGGHSLLAVQVMSRCNQVFPVKLPLRRIFETPTIAGLAEALEYTKGGEIRESLRLVRPGRSGPTLYLVHDGIGDTRLYDILARHMPEKVRVFAFDPHSTGYCPILHTRIRDMATFYVAHIRRVQPVGPYFFASLCAGGLIAFEMALQLEAQGEKVGFVALLDTLGPGMQISPWRGYKKMFGRFTATLQAGHQGSRLERFRRRATGAARKLRNYLVYEVTSRFKKLSNRIKFRVMRAVTDRGRPVPRFAQGLSVHTVLGYAIPEYQPDRLLEGAALLIRATEGEGFDEPAAALSADPTLEWASRVKGKIETFDVLGGHSTMLHEPNVRDVAKFLADRIDRFIAAGATV